MGGQVAELPKDLEEAVKAQAEARLAMSIQGYAKYLTPEAVDTLRASFQGIPPRVSSYEVTSVRENGGSYTVEVTYRSRDDDFVVRSRWKRLDADWMVAHAERLWAEGEARPGPFSRAIGSVLTWFGGLRRR
jgi:hypothetical protein